MAIDHEYGSGSVPILEIRTIATLCLSCGRVKQEIREIDISAHYDCTRIDQSWANFILNNKYMSNLCMLIRLYCDVHYVCVLYI